MSTELIFNFLWLFFWEKKERNSALMWTTIYKQNLTLGMAENLLFYFICGNAFETHKVIINKFSLPGTVYRFLRLFRWLWIVVVVYISCLLARIITLLIHKFGQAFWYIAECWSLTRGQLPACTHQLIAVTTIQHCNQHIYKVNQLLGIFAFYSLVVKIGKNSVNPNLPPNRANRILTYSYVRYPKNY